MNTSSQRKMETEENMKLEKNTKKEKWRKKGIKSILSHQIKNTKNSARL